MLRRYIVIALAVLLLCAGAWLNAQAQGPPPQGSQELAARAEALYAQGEALFREGDYREAYKLFEETVSLFHELSCPWEEMHSAFYLGSCSYMLGNYNRAIEWYLRALELSHLITGPRNEALALESLGICYQALGRHRLAIEHFQVSLCLFRDIGDRPREAAILECLGQSYYALDDYLQGIECHRLSLALFRDIEDWWGQARSLMALGSCYYTLGDYRQAIDHLMQLVILAREIGSRQGEAQGLAALGLCHYALGDYQRAIEFQSFALEIFQVLGDRKGQAESLTALSDCYYALGHYQEAVDFCEEALLIFQEIEDTWGEAQALLRLGECFEVLESFRKAVETWEQAIDAVEGLCPAPDLALRRMRMLLYELLVTALLQIGKPDEALLYAERAKTRALVDAVESTLLTQPESLSDVLRPASQALQRLAGLYRALAAPVFDLGRPTIDPGFVQALREAKEEYRAALYGLEREHPELVGLLCVDPERLGRQLERTQSWLEEGVAVLAYFVTDDTTFAWTITAEGVQTGAKIAIGRDELRENVTELRELMGSPPAPGVEMARYFEAIERSGRLYDLLVTPLEEFLENARHLVIVPSDVLFYLPFSALYRCPGCEGRALLAGEFLLERHSLSYAPSIASLTLPSLCPSEGLYRSVLALDPTEPPFSAGEEARHVAALFPQGTVFEGSEATETQVKALLAEREYDVVHVAGGCFLLDRESPLLSGIALREGAGEDGVLRVGELLGLRPPLDLLVVSSSLCLEAELWEESQEDELWVAVEGLLSSGIASAVLPLWTASDRSTRYLMEAMYQGLMGEGLPKGEALRRAQLALLDDETGIYRYPYFWALFVLYGDWGGEAMVEPPDTGKLEYELYQRLEEWKSTEHAPDESPPVIPVLLTLFRPATQEDLEAFKGLSEEIEVQGAFGHFVQLQVPLPLLEVVAALPEVRSVSPPAETILD